MLIKLRKGHVSCPFTTQVCPNFRSSQVSCFKRRSLSVIPVEAPRPRDVRLPVHPYLSDDPLPLLEPLRSLQLLCRREHVHVERALESPVPPSRQVRGGVPVRVRVAGVGGRVGGARAFLGGRSLTGLAVGATGDLDHQGEEREEEAQTHAADEEERCPLRVVCYGRGRQKTRQTFNWIFVTAAGSLLFPSDLFSCVVKKYFCMLAHRRS